MFEESKNILFLMVTNMGVHIKINALRPILWEMTLTSDHEAQDHILLLMITNMGVYIKINAL